MSFAQPSPSPSLEILAIGGDPLFRAFLMEDVAPLIPEAAFHGADTLEAGMERLKGKEADVVLLDLGLPVGLGLTALERVLAVAGGAAILTVTELRDEERSIQAIRMGAQDGLAKEGLEKEAWARAIRHAWERKAHEAQLPQPDTPERASNRLLAGMLDSMKAAIAVTDENGIIISCNTPWKLQNPSTNPLIPRESDEAFDYAKFCHGLIDHDTGVVAVAQGFLMVLSGEQARFVQDFEWGIGSEVRGFGVTIHTFRVAGSHRISIAIADITARVQADLELVRALAIKNLILENSTLGIAFVRRRVFEWANSRWGEILALPMDRILGCTTRTIFTDEASFLAMGEQTYAAMKSDERTDITWQLIRGDGTLFWCRMIGRPLSTDTPDEGSVWMLEDITERVNAEQQRLSLEVQLRHAQKLEAIGQLAAGIAHEINTPTQYIGDNTNFLAEAFKDVFRILDAQEAALGSEPESLRALKEEADLPFLRGEIPKAIEQSLDGIARVTKIVRAMKDFSHPGSDEPVEVDLNRAIESTVTVSRNEWKYVAELVLDLDPTLGVVSCFPNEMNQAVLNLVVNAAHAIADALQDEPGAKGTITVSTRRSGDSVEVRVRDTGCGIPEGVRNRIFDPFFTTKAVGKGTGQGLAIVHSVIVERHKGTVDFETELGKGSVFILRIPVPVQP